MSRSMGEIEAIVCQMTAGVDLRADVDRTIKILEEILALVADASPWPEINPRRSMQEDVLLNRLACRFGVQEGLMRQRLEQIRCSRQKPGGFRRFPGRPPRPSAIPPRPPEPPCAAADPGLSPAQQEEALLWLIQRRASDDSRATVREASIWSRSVGFSRRVRESLEGLGIKTLGELADFPPYRLTACMGLGSKSLAEIRSKLAERGLLLRGDRP